MCVMMIGLLAWSFLLQGFTALHGVGGVISNARRSSFHVVQLCVHKKANATMEESRFQICSVFFYVYQAFPRFRSRVTFDDQLVPRCLYSYGLRNT